MASNLSQKEMEKIKLQELNRRTRFDNKLKNEVRAVENIVKNR